MRTEPGNAKGWKFMSKTPAENAIPPPK